MRRSVQVVLGVVLLTVLAGGAAEAGARPPSDSPRPLRWEMDTDGKGPIEAGDLVKGSLTKIWRDADGVSFEVKTSGLVKGHGYTVWFFSYDSPEACLSAPLGASDGEKGNRCTISDLLFNPAAQGSLMWSRAGKFVKTNGPVTFKARRPRNAPPCATEPAVMTSECSGVLLGRGLHNPMTAEIHFVIRDHGPDQKGVEDETTTINGGCDPQKNAGLSLYYFGWGTPGNYGCNDPQGD